jgi:hypothetical protein
MKAFIGVASSVVGLAVFGVAVADDKHAAAEGGMTAVAPKDVKWVEGPASLPKGAKVAVIYGDPSKPALFVMRVKMPASYKIAPHWHPADENVTVLSGTLFMGHGDKLDTATGTPVPAGGFMSMPAKAHHYAYTKKEAILQISSMGPWAINYLDPADDPRTTAAATK